MLGCNLRPGESVKRCDLRVFLAVWYREPLTRDDHQQKKLILARHVKLICVQHNELITTRRNKLTRRDSQADTVRKARTIFRNSRQAPEFQQGGRHKSKGSVAHPSRAPSCKRLSPGSHKRLVYPKPPG